MFEVDIAELTRFFFFNATGPTEIYTLPLNDALPSWRVARFRTGAWVLGADTVVSIGPRVLGKPADIDEATSMLRLLSGRTHRVRTGVCLAHRDSGYEEARVVTSKVTFRKLTAAVIEAYFAEVDPLDKAGAYAIQIRGDLIIEGFSGSRSNVIGLPLEMLEDWLRELEVL